MKRHLYFLYLAFLTLPVIPWTAPALAQDDLPPVLNVAPLEEVTEEESSSKSYENVPDAYIEEALAFFNECEANTDMKRYYDCECLSVEFLDARIEKGEKANPSGIKQSIAGLCPDATYAAGDLYQECTTSPLTPGDIKIEEYCTCFANTYGRLYEESGLEPGTNTFIELKTQASLSCRDPALARKTYPMMGTKKKKSNKSRSLR